METDLYIWDLDNTLINSREAYAWALGDFSRSKNLPFDFVKIEKYYREADKYDLGWGVQLYEQQALIDEFQKFKANEPKYIPMLYSGATDVLRQLQKTGDQGLITASYRINMLQALQHHKIEQYFKNYRSLCCAKEGGYKPKPAADPLKSYIKESNHLIKNTIVIGDSPDDIGMARAAGAKSIGATWGLDTQERKDELFKAKPDLVVHNIGDIPEALYQLRNVA